MEMADWMVHSNSIICKVLYKRALGKKRKEVVELCCDARGFCTILKKKYQERRHGNGRRFS